MKKILKALAFLSLVALAAHRGCETAGLDCSWGQRCRSGSSG